MIRSVAADTEQIPVEDKAKLSLSIFACPKIQYNDEYGGTYYHYFSLRVFHNTPPRISDMHENKLFYDYCHEDYVRLSGYRAGVLQFWNEDGKNGLSKILKETYLQEKTGTR